MAVLAGPTASPSTTDGSAASSAGSNMLSTDCDSAESTADNCALTNPSTTGKSMSPMRSAR
eukprot:scaffold2951_cov99-Isochrysis_galbana.AAC.5